MTKKRANRLNAIVEYLHVVNGAGATRRQIAEQIGVKVSPHLIEMLDQIEAAGWAHKVLDDNEYPATWRYYPTKPSVGGGLTREDYGV